jgi:hypothetical protein
MRYWFQLSRGSLAQRTEKERLLSIGNDIDSICRGVLGKTRMRRSIGAWHRDNLYSARVSPTKLVRGPQSPQETRHAALTKFARCSARPQCRPVCFHWLRVARLARVHSGPSLRLRKYS